LPSWDEIPFYDGEWSFWKKSHFVNQNMIYFGESCMNSKKNVHYTAAGSVVSVKSIWSMVSFNSEVSL
jgi:hypothetical protein